MTRLGVTLPTFVDDPAVPLRVARAAEVAGVDGVFVFDHVHRDAGPRRRPALECFALLGAVAAETSRVVVGSLVARATLRPSATLAAAFDTVQRVSGGRLVAGLGAGDHESREENESFGLPFGTMSDRLAALRAAIDASRGRGYPVWVGGAHPLVRAVATEADAWNLWGAPVGEFVREARHLQAIAASPPALTWGGVVLVGATEREARRRARQLSAGPHVLVGAPERVAFELGRYAASGAAWVVAAPLDAADPEQATLLGEAVAPLLGRWTGS